jgi:ATP-dependent Clp protease ATP-binding subunit ClpB
MTSNLGSDIIRNKMEEFDNSLPPEEEESLKNEILLMLRKFMSPEFLNRVDEIVMFKPLTAEQIKEIVVIQVSGLKEMLVSRGISLSVKNTVIDWLAEKGFDPQLGARPVKRLIQKELINELSREIIAGKIVKEDEITVDIKNGNICFLNEMRKEA